MGRPNKAGLQTLAAVLLGAAVVGLGHTPWWVGSGASLAALLVMWLIDHLIGTSDKDDPAADGDEPGRPDLRYVRRK